MQAADQFWLDWQTLNIRRQAHLKLSIAGTSAVFVNWTRDHVDKK